MLVDFSFGIIASKHTKSANFILISKKSSFARFNQINQDVRFIYYTGVKCFLSLSLRASFSTARVLIVALFGFFLPKLALKFMNSGVDALVNILACFGDDKHIAVFGSGDYLNACLSGSQTIYNHLNPIDAVIEFWKFGSLLFGIAFDTFRYGDMFSCDCEKQNLPPFLY